MVNVSPTVRSAHLGSLRRRGPDWSDSSSVRTLATVGVVGGLLGAASAALLLLVPPAVRVDRYSYPFTVGGYKAIQLFFAVQHLSMVAAVLGLYRLFAGSGPRLLRAGLLVGVIGLVLLTVCEVFALTAADAPTVSPAASAVNAAYGLPTLLTGLGFLLAGIGIARDRLLVGWARWVVLVFGAWVFAVLFPALFGSDLAGRLAIGAWMLIFAGLALAVRRASHATGR